MTSMWIALVRGCQQGTVSDVINATQGFSNDKTPLHFTVVTMPPPAARSALEKNPGGDLAKQFPGLAPAELSNSS